MKKYFYLAMMALVVIFASCKNDDIEMKIGNAEITVTVDPADLFSGYNFMDTEHDISVAETFRTFHSENDMFIQARTLFYSKESGELIDSIVSYVNTTNEITNTKKISSGRYYVVTTLTFATKNQNSYWSLKDKERLATAKLQPKTKYSKWSVMSQSVDEVSIDGAVRYVTKPKPVGVLVYEYYQNFQYVSQASYGTVADNGIRALGILTQSTAESYNLDPNASNKFNYKEAGKTNQWKIVNWNEPTEYDDSWTFFKTNLYGYCYIMEPSVKLTFGYSLKGEETFNPHGEGTYQLSAGKTYLAYWDYFQVGNPYFGIADNNHWNRYNTPTPSVTLYEEPYKSWGASKATVKSTMQSRGYTLYEEQTDRLTYNGKNKEIASIYAFQDSKLWDVTIGFNASTASVATLRSYVQNLGYSYLDTSTENGVTFYFYADGSMSTMVAVYLNDNISYVEYMDYASLASSSRAMRRSNGDAEGAIIGSMALKNIPQGIIDRLKK